MVKELIYCEVCNSDLRRGILQLGEHPLCDDLTPIGESQRSCRYRQTLAYCETCRTAIHEYQVPREVLFPPSYHYRSRLTEDVLSGMHNLTDEIDLLSRRIHRGPRSDHFVVDIGCNDGSLLGFFRERGYKTIGVDPTEAIKEHDGRIDYPLQAYFNEPIASAIRERFGAPSIITMTNVFAHIENLPALLDGIRALMDSRSLLVIENHYLGSILDGGQFDTFYHEHPRTYSATSFKYVADVLGTEIIAISFPKRYGGNIRVVMGSAAGWSETQHWPDESDFGKRLVALQRHYDSWVQETTSDILDLAAEGTVVGKALPGRAVMLISSLRLDASVMPRIYEKPTSPKVGNYVPDTDIEVVSDAFLHQETAQNMIIWAWHIEREVTEYVRALGYSGDLWSPMPRLHRV